MSDGGRQRTDPEVPERARRRTFTAKYKLKTLAGYEAAAEGEKGALLRREGLYSSHIDSWRRAPRRRAAGRVSCAAGTQAARPASRAKQQLEQELAKARFVVDVQARLHALLGTISESAQPGNGTNRYR